MASYVKLNSGIFWLDQLSQLSPILAMFENFYAEIRQKLPKNPDLMSYTCPIVAQEFVIFFVSLIVSPDITSEKLPNISKNSCSGIYRNSRSSMQHYVRPYLTK